jgi:hypothetical protein
LLVRALRRQSLAVQGRLGDIAVPKLVHQAMDLAFLFIDFPKQAIVQLVHIPFMFCVPL